METQQIKTLLENVLAQKRQEIQIFELASQIVNGEFESDLQQEVEPLLAVIADLRTKITSGNNEAAPQEVPL